MANPKTQEPSAEEIAPREAWCQQLILVPDPDMTTERHALQEWCTDADIWLQIGTIWDDDIAIARCSERFEPEVIQQAARFGWKHSTTRPTPALYERPDERYPLRSGCVWRAVDRVLADPGHMSRTLGGIWRQLLLEAKAHAIADDSVHGDWRQQRLLLEGARTNGFDPDTFVRNAGGDGDEYYRALRSLEALGLLEHVGDTGLVRCPIGV